MRARIGMAAVLGGGLLVAGCSEAPPRAGSRGSVEVMYSFDGDQAAGFREAVGTWASAHGVAVTYTRSDDLAADVAARERTGRLPDVLVVPQPGLLQELRRRGSVVALDDRVPLDKIANDLVPGLLEPLRSGGHTYAVPVAMNVKSLLWYDRHGLHSRHLDPPQTITELLADTAALRKAGSTPWCLGLADGPSSGWAGTDWVEELVLKEQGPQVYDDWVAGRIGFSDPRITAAFTAYADGVLRSHGVEGGGGEAVSRSVRHAADGLFASPQRCSLLKQGSYVTQSGFMPEAVRTHVDEATSVVAFPAGRSDALEVAGDAAAVVRGADEQASGLVRYMATDPRFGAEWAGSSDRGFISPRRTFPLVRYSSTTTRKIASAAYSADVVRFDASDQMPPALGQKAFWSAMVDLTAGRATVDEVVARLDSAR